MVLLPSVNDHKNVFSFVAFPVKYKRDRKQFITKDCKIKPEDREVAYLTSVYKKIEETTQASTEVSTCWLPWKDYKIYSHNIYVIGNILVYYFVSIFRESQ